MDPQSHRSSQKRKFSDGSSLIPRPAKKLSYSSSVCHDCSTLNLRELIAKAQKSYASYSLPDQSIFSMIWLGDVDFRYRELRDNNCIICQILFRSRFSTSDQPFKQNFIYDKGDDLWMCSLSLCSKLVSMENRDKIPVGDDTICLITLPKSSRGFIEGSRIQNQVLGKGVAVLLLDDRGSSIFTPQPVTPLWDPGPAKVWLEYCKQNHGMLCGSKHPNIGDLQVIDCKTLSIQEAELNMPYVTLSYVWGSEGCCGGMQDAGGTKKLPGQLSSVIRDSIQVTMALGFRYLWIEKFCIDQNNPSTKHDQIQQMDAIYENSELTIVAAAGADETYGLPGVGTRSRTSQLICKDQGITLMLASKDPQKEIQSSHWSTRGWTFQEAILSRRCLVFTDNQVYFECNSMNCFESICSHLDSIHVDNKSKIHDYHRAGIFGLNLGQRFGCLSLEKHSPNDNMSLYLSHVQHYSRRKLSHDQDSLNAFQGIIRRFSRQESSIRSIWGLCCLKDSPNRSFAFSLTWYHKKGQDMLQRRHDFPSWTWAGWDGVVQYRSTSVKEDSFTSLVSDLVLEGGDSDLTELVDLTRSTQDDCAHRVLGLRMRIIPNSQISCCPSTPRQWVIDERYASLYLSCGTEEQLTAGVCRDSEWRFGIIGGLEDAWIIMALKPNLPRGPNLWTRAGVIVVHGRAPDFESYKDFETFRIV